jgi:DNA-binding IclR family transcriptional regulator
MADEFQRQLDLRGTDEHRERRSRHELRSQVAREFHEMGGMALTSSQASRLFGLDPVRCERVLDELVKDGLLQRTPDGTYARSHGE